ncbi:MAG: protein tyrosine phosphatase family protein [Candidatus Tectomicrobia bacterium]|nr:protein tyrosine phosphatase family protein [Candidatus Tectomicrobia bacterium]
MALPQLSDIYNFLSISDDLGTSGQPTSAQLAAVKEAGYNVVINLATGATPRDLPNEAALVGELGLDYIHIPVVWDDPTDDDLAQFFEAMEKTQDRKRFVHCIANMRVSAFVLLYRVLRQKISLDEAQASMNQIWRPNETWQAFINQSLAQG